MFHPLLTALAVTAALALAHSPAHAHDHGPRQSQGGGHGAHHAGDIQHIGEKHLELVVQAGKLVAYLTDEDNRELSGEGVRVSGVVLTGGNQRNVTFSHAGGNRLEAEGGFEGVSDLRAVLTVALPGGETHRARFQLTK